MNTPQIKLRAMEPEDLDELYAIENDPALWNAGQTNVPYSRYALHEYIAHATADIYADRQVRLLAENNDGQVVGIVDLVNFDPRHLRAEIGVVIKAPFRRQGYATAALGELISYARNLLHLHQLYAIVDVDNTASAQLFYKLGFLSSAHLDQWLFDGEKYRNAIFMQFFL